MSGHRNVSILVCTSRAQLNAGDCPEDAPETFGSEVFGVTSHVGVFVRDGCEALDADFVLDLVAVHDSSLPVW